MRSREKSLRFCQAAAGWCLSAVVAPVVAATIGINGSVLTAFADAGDDVLSVSASATNLVFSGVAFDVVTPGCTGVTFCTLLGLTEVRIDMLAGDDVVDLSGLPA